MFRRHAAILLIVFAALLLRLYALSRGDAHMDEVGIAIRSLGMLDTLFDPLQTTPIEWLDPERPFWTRVSFHDHPPVTFGTQHLFMQLFGESRFAFRLPSALLGVGSVLLLYGIGSALYSRRTGLIAAALLGVGVNHVFVSRVGLQEAYLLFFMLLFVYFLARSLDEERFLLGAGAALGFAMLSKYIAIVLVPIAAVVLALLRPRCFLSPRLWLGIGLSLVIFSPVLYYNWKLYETFGHFDFQLSYVLGQNPESWTIRTGKDMLGGPAGHLRLFLPGLSHSHSVPFLALFAASIAAGGVALFREPAASLRRHALLLAACFFLLLLTLRAGPSYRFLALFTPLMALAVARLLDRLGAGRSRAATASVALLLVFEAGFTANSVIAYDAVGPAPYLHARGPRSEVHRWGYNDLSDYLEERLEGKRPQPVIAKQYRFLEALRDEAVAEQTEAGLDPLSIAIVFDGSLGAQSRTWAVLRWSIYHAWVVLDANDHLRVMDSLGTRNVTGTGFDEYVFILPTERIPLQHDGLTPAGRALEAKLQARGAEPRRLANSRGEEIFRIYELDATPARSLLR